MKDFNKYINEFVIDKESPIPSYYQLETFIKNMVDKGYVKANQRLPSEREMSVILNLSRMTVRKSFSDLVKEGFLYREVGNGTYISPPKIVQPIMRPISFSENMHLHGMTASGKTIKKEKMETNNKEINDALKIDDQDEILFIERLRYADNVPLVLEKSFFNYGKYNFLMNADLDNNSLYDLLKKYKGIVPVSSNEIIEAGLSDEILSGTLQIEKGTPILIVTGISCSIDNEPVEYVVSYYRGDKYKFYIGLENK